ncbi:MAG: peptidase M22 [Alicyclobacillus shizuokensis]|nr:peptidase M22 [Alicyclobacillus shizuokensis]
MQWVLGIDTSNYTTSLAAVEWTEGRRVVQARSILPVPHGERGLRQSEALFFHVQRLPGLFDQLYAQLVTHDAHVVWRGIGVSVRPRPSCRSYMPVFSAGWSLASSLARTLGVPVLPVSHQENHLSAAEFALLRMASVETAGQESLFPLGAPFIGIHLSGGTSDVVLAQSTRFGYRIDPVGEGMDLHAGQFVDRVGVAIGLPFPTGPHLERLAEQADEALALPSRVVQGKMSFSGPCSAALRALADGAAPASVAKGVQVCIANSVVKAVMYAYARCPDAAGVLIAGGVAGNRAIQGRVLHRLRIQAPRLAIRFAPPEYACDNAVGCAHLARRFLSGTRPDS